MTKANTSTAIPTCRALAPQFLVDDLEKSIAYYRDKLGFTVDFTYGGFYAGLRRDAAELHLKHAPKTMADRMHRRHNEHLDASVAVKGIDALCAELQQRGAQIIKPLENRPWGT
ncbi:MAG: VOC family protein, partial [Phycisphaeraceae bacterium]|nr:VOC family protein [Phycisphaeraceae bacterium]